jgi:hypothetical protein
VHCAGSRTGDGDKARQLVRAASRAGVRHLVHISVVGADRIPVRGYLRAADAHRLLVPVRVPGGAARAIRAGANLITPGTGGAAAGRTWEDFLATAVLTSV